MWPSGKAPGFGPGIRGFESLRPSQSDGIHMKRSNHAITPVFFGFVGLLFVVLAPFIAFRLLDSRETPHQQLNNLALTTNSLVGEVTAGHSYSVAVASPPHCTNQGQAAFFAFGRDTIHCTYTVDVRTDLKGQNLRIRIEQLGGWRGLYNDGSGSTYSLSYKGARCSIGDGRQYRSKLEASNNFQDGYLIIDCQSFTEHYDSPLPAPKHPTD